MSEFEKLIITGVGRSGTRYAAKLFERLGLKAAHQKVYHHEGGPFWKPPRGAPYIVASSAFAAPHSSCMPKNWLIVHQVRDPRLVVGSLIKQKHVPTGKDGRAVNFYLQHTQGLLDITDLIDRAWSLWLQWNELVEQINRQDNYMLIRLQDYSVGFLELVVALLGHEWQSEYAYFFQKLDRTIGSTSKTTPERLPKDPTLREACLQKALDYGWTDKDLSHWQFDSQLIEHGI